MPIDDPKIAKYNFVSYSEKESPLHKFANIRANPLYKIFISILFTIVLLILSMVTFTYVTGDFTIITKYANFLPLESIPFFNTTVANPKVVLLNAFKKSDFEFSSIYSTLQSEINDSDGSSIKVDIQGLNDLNDQNIGNYDINYSSKTGKIPNFRINAPYSIGKDGTIYTKYDTTLIDSFIKLSGDENVNNPALQKLLSEIDDKNIAITSQGYLNLNEILPNNMGLPTEQSIINLRKEIVNVLKKEDIASIIFSLVDDSEFKYQPRIIYNGKQYIVISTKIDTKSISSDRFNKVILDLFKTPSVTINTYCNFYQVFADMFKYQDETKFDTSKCNQQGIEVFNITNNTVKNNKEYYKTFIGDQNSYMNFNFNIEFYVDLDNGHISGFKTDGDLALENRILKYSFKQTEEKINQKNILPQNALNIEDLIREYKTNNITDNPALTSKIPNLISKGIIPANDILLTSSTSSFNTETAIILFPTPTKAKNYLLEKSSNQNSDIFVNKTKNENFTYSRKNREVTINYSRQ